jgi:hypothetical protein
MPRTLLRCCALLAALGLFGCRKADPVAPDDDPPDTTSRLGDSTEHDLADWLKQPRAQLAAHVKEAAAAAAKLQSGAREDPQTLVLLPRFAPPLAAPVLNRTAFDPDRGVSVPAWLAAGERDADLARHLARHGDVESALKLAPADPTLRRELEALRGERDFPVEWAQLVGLTVYAAEMRVARGEIEGATDIVLIHRQLRELLGPRHAKGPLGAALLPLGRRALVLGAAAWRLPHHNKPLLADDIDAALKEWGDAPAPALPSAARGAAGLFGVAPQGRAVTFVTPAQRDRALDLLALPAPPEGVSAVVAFLDGGRPSEVLFAYRGKVAELYLDDVSLAYGLAERDFAARPAEKDSSLPWQCFAGGGLTYDVALLPRSPVLGGLVRVRAADAAPAAAPLPRHLGPAHLDRTFEQARRQVGPGGESERLVTYKAAAVLERFRDPIARAPAAATLARAADAASRFDDPVASVALAWPTEANFEALTKVVVPLWSLLGPARVENVESEGRTGSHLALTWQDAKTRFVLTLPYHDEEGPELVVADARGPEALKERRAEATRFDRQERAERWEKGQRFERLPRSLVVAGVKLGDPRAKAEKVLAAIPESKARREPFAGGVLVVCTDPVPPTATFHPRQLIVRFGPDDTVAEVRAVYAEPGVKPTANNPTLADLLRQDCGAPEKGPAPWARLWADLPAQGSASFQRWLDDQTFMTYQRDGGGGEVVLRDRPLAQFDGVPLPPLAFVSRGVEGCLLGQGKDAVLKRFGAEKAAPAEDGGHVLTLPAKSPYDVAVVYFDDEGRVARVLGRHRAAAAGADLSGPLTQVWDRDWATLGAVRRVEAGEGGKGGVTAYGWHDDTVRVRTFGAKTSQGPVLFTEWRHWPVAPARALARP